MQAERKSLCGGISVTTGVPYSISSRAVAQRTRDKGIVLHAFKPEGKNSNEMLQAEEAILQIVEEDTRASRRGMTRVIRIIRMNYEIK